MSETTCFGCFFCAFMGENWEIGDRITQKQSAGYYPFFL